MSIALMNAVWKADLPSTRKLVALSLADQANDSGECYPSIAMIAQRCGLSERVVHICLRDIEAQGIVKKSCRAGRSTVYCFADPCTWCTPERGAPLNDVHTTPAPRADPGMHVVHPTPARGAPITTNNHQLNHQEPKEAGKKPPAKKGAGAPSVPDGVSQQTWADWLQLRKAKKAPVTETVLKNAREEAAKAGLTLNRFLEVWCARGSQGLQAEWLKPHERGTPVASSGRVPVNADFSAKTYHGDTDDELPIFLREPG